MISSNSINPEPPSSWQARCVNRGWQVLVYAWLAIMPALSGAVSVTDIYSAVVRVTDRSEAARSAAISEALGVVLTKVSGRRDAGARAGVGNAAQLVQRYGYVTGGQLEVGFDSEAIHAALDRAGLPLWDRERPNTLMVFPQALRDMREARVAVELAARNRGLPVVWANAETSEQYLASALGQIQSLAQRYEAEAVLLARMGASGTPSDLRWQLVFRGASQEAGGGIEAGPALAAENISRYYAVTTRETSHLVMEVSGVDSIEAYAGTMSYLQGLLLVRGLAVEALQGGVLRVKLELHGTVDALHRVLTVDKRLSALDSAAGDVSGAVSYRYNR